MRTPLPSVAAIQRAVADHYGVTVGDLRRERPIGVRGVNTFEFSRPRQAAMALSVMLTELSYPRIGQFFGNRNHATVRHANVSVARRRRNDPALHEFMRRLTLDLVRH